MAQSAPDIAAAHIAPRRTSAFRSWNVGADGCRRHCPVTPRRCHVWVVGPCGLDGRSASAGATAWASGSLTSSRVRAFHFLGRVDRGGQRQLHEQRMEPGRQTLDLGLPERAPRVAVGDHVRVDRRARIGEQGRQPSALLGRLSRPPRVGTECRDQVLDATAEGLAPRRGWTTRSTASTVWATASLASKPCPRNIWLVRCMRIEASPVVNGMRLLREDALRPSQRGRRRRPMSGTTGVWPWCS